jgi:hypothetical protein
MPHINRKLAFLAVPAVLAVGAIGYGSVVAMAAPTPTASAAPSQSAAAEPAESSTEQPETAAEQAEPNEPAQPGGGYADTNETADTQQEGIH